MLRPLRGELQPVVRRRPSSVAAANKYLLAWNDPRAPFVISAAS
jgi:hypothetical protein